MVWKAYKHRFVPWIAINWSNRQVKQPDASGSVHKECSALKQLSHLCEKLDINGSFPPCTVREWKKMAKEPRVLDDLVSQARSVMQREFGLLLSLRRSSVDRDGLGVFVRNTVAKEQVVGLYPGEFYYSLA